MVKKSSLLLSLLLTFALVLSACATNGGNNTGLDNDTGLGNGLGTVEPGLDDGLGTAEPGLGDDLATEVPDLGDDLATEVPDQGFGIATEAAPGDAPMTEEPGMATEAPGTGEGTTAEPPGMGGVTEEPGAAGGLPVAEDPGADLNRVSNLIGHEISGAAEENLGSIDSLIVDSQSGQIVYALVQAGEALEIDNDFVAIPWSELSIMDDAAAESEMDTEGLEDDAGTAVAATEPVTGTEDMTDDLMETGQTRIMYNGDLATVEASPGLAADDLGEGDILGADFDTELSSYWSNEVASLPQTGTEETGVGLVRLQNVSDKQLTNAEGEDLGDIEDMIVDRANNAISWVIAGTGGFLDIGEELIPVPFEMLRFQPNEDDANESDIILNASNTDLESAPRFQGEIPDTSIEGWDADFNSYWEGIQPVDEAGTDAESGTEGQGDN